MSVLKTLGRTFFPVQFLTTNSLIDEAAEVTKSTVMIHNDGSSKVRLTLIHDSYMQYSDLPRRLGLSDFFCPTIACVLAHFSPFDGLPFLH
jgi:hypothetical protein